MDGCDRLNFRSSQNGDLMCLLQNRLHELGLEAVDCGGSGDCFFRSVSHQMFGSAVNHFEVRLAGVQYVREHPEQFIEFVQGQSWLDYLSRMCSQGTWCDAAIVQGVADAYNSRINIVETAPGFCERTVVEPHHSYEPCRSIFIGHVGEYHYVSTVPMLSCVLSESDNERVTVSEQSRSNSCVSLESSFYCGYN